MSTAYPFDIDALVEYFLERTQDALRGVYSYNEYGNVKTHYVRDDIDRAYDGEELASMLRKGLTVEQALRDVDPDGPVGLPRASLHTFDNAVVVQLFGSSLERGVIAVFNKDIAGRHTEFVDEATTVMLSEEETPQE